MPFIPVITIDGPGGAGKGTLGRLLAQDLGYHFLDSGALYRVFAYAAHEQGLAPEDIKALETLALQLDVVFYPEKVLLAGQDVSKELRTEVVGEAASIFAAIPEVRQALLDRQRTFSELPGLIADGRDMGTVVFPEAVLKIFLTASPEERAKRRQKQLREAGKSVNLSSLLEDIRRRDERDSQRAVAPLEPAADAVIIDTTDLDINHALAKVKAAMRDRSLP